MREPTRDRQAGFTLVELMTVVTLTGVLAVLAVVSWHKSNAQVGTDGWPRSIRAQVLAASRRAVATASPYMVDLKATSVQYCVIDPATINTSNWTTTQTTCAGLGTGLELGPLIGAPKDATTSYTAATADITQPNGTYAAPTKTVMSTGSVLIYLGANGTAAGNLSDVETRGVVPSGFTAYTRRTAIDETSKRRRVVVYGVSSKVHIVDNY